MKKCDELKALKKSKTIKSWEEIEKGMVISFKY